MRIKVLSYLPEKEADIDISVYALVANLAIFVVGLVWFREAARQHWKRQLASPSQLVHVPLNMVMSFALMMAGMARACEVVISWGLKAIMRIGLG